MVGTKTWDPFRVALLLGFMMALSLVCVPLIHAQIADPDGDGRTNLDEYLTRLNACAAD